MFTKKRLSSFNMLFGAGVLTSSSTSGTTIHKKLGIGIFQKSGIDKLENTGRARLRFNPLPNEAVTGPHGQFGVEF